MSVSAQVDETARSSDVLSASPNLSWKRLFDIFFAATALLVLAPLFFAIVVALLVTSGRPVFFKQSRVGRGGEDFGCLKFRTMVLDADEQLRKVLETSEESRREWAETQKLRNDPRIHPVGRFLRKTSLDELPQFLNVIKGDMSVVGPRPIVHNEVPRFGENIAFYRAVRPGVTGLWQVSGRNSLTYQERVQLEVEYVKNWSRTRDIKIILKTVGIVLKSNGDH